MKVRPLAGVLLAAAVCVACMPSEKPPEAVRLGVVSLPSYALLWLAEERGHFEAARVSVEMKTYAFGRRALSAAESGEVDLATVYTTPILHDAFEGERLALATQLHRAERLTGLVMRGGDRPIRGTTDLQGKRIGLSAGTSGNYVLSLLLAEAGIPSERVEVVNLDQPALIEALRAGSVDGAVVWAQFLFQAQAAAGKNAVTLFSDAYTEVSFLAGRRARLEEKSEAVTRLVSALWRAEQELDADPALAVDLLRRRFPALQEDELRRVVENSRYELGLSHLSLTMLRQEAAWMYDRSAGSAASPRVRDLLWPDALVRLAPETVTAVVSGQQR